MTKILLLSVGIAAALVVAIWFMITAQVRRDLTKLGKDANLKLGVFDIFPPVFWAVLLIVILVFQFALIATFILGGHIYG